MHTSLPSLLLLTLAAIAASTDAMAQGTQFNLVVPTSLEAVEGPTSTALPFGSSLQRRVMYAYDGSAAGQATGGYNAPVRIAAIELRCDGIAPGSSAAGTYVFSLSVSTSKNAVGALDPVFNNNHGADKALVHSGSLSVPAPAVGSAPNPFSLRIPCNLLFEWDPRNGPLLLDFAYSASTPAFGSWDAANFGVSGLAATSSGATTATSTLTTAPVLRLDLPGDVQPAGFDATSSANFTGFPWNQLATVTARTLNLFEGSTINFTGRRRITALAWRTGNGASFTGRTYDVRITMSTTSRTVGTMTSTYADQIGPDAVAVFDGTLVAGPSPASADPTQFDVYCELQRPFEYDPLLGSLSIDYQLRGSTGATGASFEASNQTSLLVGRLFSSGSATAATGGTPQHGVALITALRTVPVPTVPVSLANAVNPGANFTAFPFSNPLCRSQQIISAAEGILNQPTFVRALRFRPAATSYGPSTFTCTIDISTPATVPNTVSPTFDLNHGSNRVRVFDGSFSVPFGTRLATGTDFPIEIKLQRPFLWNAPTVPYLCIDIVMSSRTGPGINIETTNGLTTDDARVTSAGANPTTGTAQNFAAVIQLSTDVQNGTAVNYSGGCAGLNGTPQTTTVGLPQLPNPDFAIRVRNAAGNSIALLLIGLSNATIPLPGAPGCSVLNGVEIGALGFAITDPAGNGTVPLPLPTGASFDGFAFRSQWLVLDAAANAAGMVVSDGQLLTTRFF